VATEPKRRRKGTGETMPPAFHERFNIELKDKDAKKRFLNRVRNYIFENFFQRKAFNGVLKNRILWQVANALGEEYKDYYDFDLYVSSDFYRCLQVLETAYAALGAETQKQELTVLIQLVIYQSETDLGIVWQEGHFIKRGAKFLDEGLVNEPLRWLRDPKYRNVLAPFKKGLSHFVESEKEPERLADTVTDMYEALEALAKVITERPRKDLSANAELFVKKLKLGDCYNKMLKDYISYANEFRHGVEEGRQRPLPSPREVEAFIYTTGLFIRLAIAET
jgi:broad specificity phosphatase PhoE